jgi:hypothetical protein
VIWGLLHTTQWILKDLVLQEKADLLQEIWVQDQKVLIHYLVIVDQLVDLLQKVIWGLLHTTQWILKDLVLQEKADLLQEIWVQDQVILWDLHRMIWVVCILTWMMQQLMVLKIRDQEHQIQWPVIWMVTA